MLTILRTDSTHPDFIELVKKLDAYLAIIDGNEHSFYSQFNKIDLLKNAVVVYQDGHAAGCGAMKEYAPGSMEIKRMYTLPEMRGKGIATTILTELEKWALKLNYTPCILETGIRQPEAIALYKKTGYTFIPNYGQYAGVANSLCFEKKVT